MLVFGGVIPIVNFKVGAALYLRDVGVDDSC